MIATTSECKNAASDVDFAASLIVENGAHDYAAAGLMDFPGVPKESITTGVRKYVGPGYIPDSVVQDGARTGVGGRIELEISPGALIEYPVIADRAAEHGRRGAVLFVRSAGVAQDHAVRDGTRVEKTMVGRERGGAADGAAVKREAASRRTSRHADVLIDVCPACGNGGESRAGKSAAVELVGAAIEENEATCDVHAAVGIEHRTTLIQTAAFETKLSSE